MSKLLKDKIRISMLDNETLALTTRPHLLSIGLADIYVDRAFIAEIKNELSKCSGSFSKPIEMIYANISAFEFLPSWEEQQAVLRDIDQSTVKFWLNQDRTLSKPLFDGVANVPISKVLLDIQKFHDLCPPDVANFVFAHGALQDLTWLSTLYDDIGIKFPWSYRSGLCYRTVFSQVRKQTYYDMMSSANVKFVPHSAKDDAIYQLIILILIMANEDIWFE
jgi:hypothetical protein